MKLYEITGEMAALNALDADDEGMAVAIRDTLEGMSGELEAKAQGIVCFMRNIDADVDALSAEIERLTARKRTLQNRIESIREYLRSNMERAGITKIECPLFSIRCQIGRDMAVIDDEYLLPDEYVTVKTEIKPIKADITKALKEGKAVPGAHLELSKSSLVIK